MSEFDYASSNAKLASLSLGFEHGEQTSLVIPGDIYTEEEYHTNVIASGAGLHGQMLRLSGKIALDSRLTVRRLL